MIPNWEKKGTNSIESHQIKDKWSCSVKVERPRCHLKFILWIILPHNVSETQKVTTFISNLIIFLVSWKFKRIFNQSVPYFEKWFSQNMENLIFISKTEKDHKKWKKICDNIWLAIQLFLKSIETTVGRHFLTNKHFPQIH